jgi:hypothetical protein
VQVSFTQEKIMEQLDDNGLYYDWWDIENAFMWGVGVGAFVVAAIGFAVFGSW